MPATVLHRCPRWKSCAKAAERQRQPRRQLLPLPQLRPRLQPLQRPQPQPPPPQRLQLRRARHSVSNGDTDTDADGECTTAPAIHLRPHQSDLPGRFQHRGLGQHHRLVHSACSRFAACHAEAPAKAGAKCKGVSPVDPRLIETAATAVFYLLARRLRFPSAHPIIKRAGSEKRRLFPRDRLCGKHSHNTRHDQAARQKRERSACDQQEVEA